MVEQYNFQPVRRAVRMCARRWINQNYITSYCKFAIIFNTRWYIICVIVHGYSLLQCVKARNIMCQCDPKSLVSVTWRHICRPVCWMISLVLCWILGHSMDLKVRPIISWVCFRIFRASSVCWVLSVIFKHLIFPTSACATRFNNIKNSDNNTSKYSS